MEEDECNENGQRRELTEGQAEKRDEGEVCNEEEEEEKEEQ